LEVETTTMKGIIMLKIFLSRLNLVTEVATNTQQQCLNQMQKAIERVDANSRVNLLRTDYLE